MTDKKTDWVQVALIMFGLLVLFIYVFVDPAREFIDSMAQGVV